MSAAVENVSQRRNQLHDDKQRVVFFTFKLLHIFGFGTAVLKSAKSENVANI